ncbi:MAG: lipoyl synthase [Candidatus Micrarchaeota archaeon]
MEPQAKTRIPKPDWLKIRPPTTEQYGELREKISKTGLHTVCEEAHCPNMSECWSNGTAAFLILGDVCTRSCGFCATKSAVNGKSVDEKEPEQLAKTIREMKLDYAVLTSVDRDDLKDDGANHFAACILETKKQNPKTRIEVLVPDFSGKKELISMVVNAGPDVFGHNLETVERLQKKVRDQRANYTQSLLVLKRAKELAKKKRLELLTKSSLMLGMGETKEEVLEAMDDLRNAKVDIMYLGQYLQPSQKQLSVQRFVTPKEFEEFKQAALEKGFLACQSGPFVRSSYRAAEFFLKNRPESAL